jgi:Flp pilus assembly protein TadG
LTAIKCLRALWRDFANARAASVSVIMGLTFIPMVGLVGIAIDYAKALEVKAKMTVAADAASLAAITRAQADVGAGLTASQAITNGVAAANGVFNGNIMNKADMLAQPITVNLTQTGRSFTATVSFQAAYPTLFARIMTINTMNVTGGSTASVTLPSYLNFHLLLDVSGSMGIPSTAAGQNRLAAINPDMKAEYPGGCTFACHFTPNTCTTNGHAVHCQGYDLSRTNGTGTAIANNYCPQPGLSTCIQLRVDAVAYAVQRLLATAQTAQTLPNQFSVGLYPFITHMQPYQPITSNLTTVSTAATNLPSLLDVGSGVNVAGQLGSGGTHFENALSEMNAAITTVGDGSSATSGKPFVFLVTDGAQDPQYYNGGGNWSGSNHATTINSADCALLKNRGITVSVLYVPYVPIQNVNASFAGDEDDYANWNIPNIPPALQACSSQGFFFTANSPADITSAMQAMFAQAVQQARLIQ